MQSRKTFIKKLAAASLLPILPLSAMDIGTHSTKAKKEMEKPKIIFFDVNETLLDMDPLKISIEKLLNGNKELSSLWFATMLQYSLVTTVSNQYFDFGNVGAAALQMLAKNKGMEISEKDAHNIIKQILFLKPHPEVKEALSLLKSNNYKLVTFTNSSNYAIKQQLKNSGLTSFFDSSISIEDYGKFKPDISVYHWAARNYGVKNEECLLIAAHGWDIAGAKWADWKGAFVSRKEQQLFPLAPLPEIEEKDLLKLAQKIISL